MITNRLEWDIVKKNFWIANYRPQGIVLVAGSKTALMSMINRWEREQEIE